MGFEPTTSDSIRDQSLYQLNYAEIQRSRGRYLITFGRFMSGALRRYAGTYFKPRISIMHSHEYVSAHRAIQLGQRRRRKVRQHLPISESTQQSCTHGQVKDRT